MPNWQFCNTKFKMILIFSVIVSHLSYNVMKVFPMSFVKHHITKQLNEVAASFFISECTVCCNTHIYFSQILKNNKKNNMILTKQ